MLELIQAFSIVYSRLLNANREVIRLIRINQDLEYFCIAALAIDVKDLNSHILVQELAHNC